MVLKAMENLIDDLKLIKALEYGIRKEKHLNGDQLAESYRKSDRAGWMLDKMYDNLFLVCQENERKDDGSGDIRSDEQKQVHQECFGLMARIKSSKVL